MSTASAACGETSTSRRLMGTFISSQACASITWCLTAKASFASSRFMWREQNTPMTRRSAGCQLVSMTSPLSWQRNKSWSMKKSKILGNIWDVLPQQRLLNVLGLVSFSFESFLFFRVTLPVHISGILVEENTIYIRLYSKMGITVTWNKDDAVMVRLCGSIWVQNKCNCNLIIIFIWILVWFKFYKPKIH